MNRREILVAVIVVLLVVGSYRTLQLVETSESTQLQIALVYDPQEAPGKGVRAAYNAYFEEQGIPHVWIANRDLMLLPADQTARHYLAVLFVDGVNGFVPSQLVSVMDDYVRAGGNVAVIADAGTRSNRHDLYLKNAAFSQLAGVDYMRRRTGGRLALFNGPIRFKDAATAQWWHVPQGKLAAESTLATYNYATEIFPLRAAASIGAVVDARSADTAVLTRRAVGKGTVVYINIPLGIMRASVDSFPMHAFLSAFLWNVAQIPHFVPAPDGIGRLIVNFHIDSSIEFRGIPNLRRHNLLRRDVPMEFDVTAGPDRDRAGDGLGFDACGKGKPYLAELQRFGTIGSHGGWAHNEFAYAVEAGRLNQNAMEKLIQKNNDCLRSQTHESVGGYAAPAGAHPQPAMTKALEDLGMAGYYYAGDSGAPAERAFANGKMVSKRVWAFPIIPNQRVASIAEMARAADSPRQVARWLDSTIDYTGRDRGIHLIYSHSYDLLRTKYDEPFAQFLNKLSRARREHRVLTGGIADAGDFMNRFLKTTYSFTRRKNAIVLTADNPMGLERIAFAIPRSKLSKRFRLPAGLVDRGRDPVFRYFSISARTNHVRYSFPTVNQ